MAYMRRAVSDHKDVVDVFEAMNFSWLQDITMTNDGNAIVPATTNTWTEYDNVFDHFQYDVGHLADYAPDWQSETYGYAEAPVTPQVTQTTKTTTYTDPYSQT